MSTEMVPETIGLVPQAQTLGGRIELVKNDQPAISGTIERKAKSDLNAMLTLYSSQALETVQVSVVIPALNEEDNLPHVLPLIPKWVYEVILVDGHSTDRTIEVARELLPDIHVVMQDGAGKGSALRTGFAAASGQIIVMLDADGSTNPAEIPVFVGALMAGADFVKGSRFLQGGGTADMPFHRRAGNSAFVGLSRLLFGGHYTDLCYGYNAMWAWTLPLLRLNGQGFEIETMMNVRALQVGLKVAEVPSFEAPRVHGVGRLRTIPDGWRVLKTLYREWASPIPQTAIGRPQAFAPVVELEGAD